MMVKTIFFILILVFSVSLVHAQFLDVPVNERITIKKLNTHNNAEINTLATPWRYWSGSIRMTDNIHISPSEDTDGSSRVCYTSGSTLYLAKLDANDDRVGTDLQYSPAIRCRGVVGFADRVAFLAEVSSSPQNNMMFVILSDSGSTLASLNLDDRIPGGQLGDGRLMYGYHQGEYQFRAYFHVHSDGSCVASGHEGDTLKKISADGSSFQTLWCWGCSHSMEMRMAYSNNTQTIGVSCISDCYPSKSICYEHSKREHIWDVEANCAGGYGGGLGGMTPVGNDFLMTFTAPRELGGPTTDLGLRRIETRSPYGISDVVWLTETNSDEIGSHTALYRHNTVIVGWVRKTGTDYRFLIAEIDDRGNFISGPDDVTGRYGWSERNDFVSHANGDVGWAFTWVNVTTPWNYYTKMDNFYVMRVKADCETYFKWPIAEIMMGYFLFGISFVVFALLPLIGLAIVFLVFLVYSIIRRREEFVEEVVRRITFEKEVSKKSSDVKLRRVGEKSTTTSVTSSRTTDTKTSSTQNEVVEFEVEEANSSSFSSRTVTRSSSTGPSRAIGQTTMTRTATAVDSNVVTNVSRGPPPRYTRASGRGGSRARGTRRGRGSRPPR